MSEFDAKGVSVAAVSVDEKDDSAAFASEEKIKMPLLSDPGRKIIAAYGVADKAKEIAVPSAFIIRKDKTIAWRYVGEDMTDRPDARKLLELAAIAK